MLLVLVAGGLVATNLSGDDLTVVAGEDETEPGSTPDGQGGAVADQVGDAAAPHFDLVNVELNAVADGLQVVWMLAGPVPGNPDPVEYRVTFGDSAGEITPTVLRVRLDGDNRSAAVAKCPASESGGADCSGRSFRGLASAPEVRGDLVFVTISPSEIEVPLARLVWTAEVLRLR